MYTASYKSVLVGICFVFLVAENLKGEDKIDVFKARKIAIPVLTPVKAEDIKWLFQYWKCNDRVIRGVPIAGDEFQSIESMDFRDASPKPRKSNESKGLSLHPECRSAANGQNLISGNIQLYNGLFFYGGIMADSFLFKRDPTDPPAWFLLEQTVSWDVYLFQREKTPVDGDLKKENPETRGGKKGAKKGSQ